MHRHRCCWSTSAIRDALALLLLAAAVANAAPVPGWAKPLLKTPRPSGDYVRSDDDWLLIHNEVLVGAAPGGGLQREHRQVFEAVGAEPARLVVAVDYDEAAEDLVGPFVWVPGWSGHTTLNLAKSSVDVPQLDDEYVTSSRVFYASTKPIKPGKRVVVNWTVVDREDYPGEAIIVPVEGEPTARFVARAAADADVHLFNVVPGQPPTPVAADGVALTDIPGGAEVYPQGDPWRPAPLAALPYVYATRTTPAQLTWQTLAERTATLFDAVLTSDDPTDYRAKARELTATASGTIERIERLAGFAQSLVYRNIEWGIGAFRPDAPSEALRSMSADCKAKVLLLEAMLGSIGVRSVPVLVRVDPQYQGRPAPPMVQAFNHVVLAIDAGADARLQGRLLDGPGAGWVVFDPTDELASFGRRASSLEGGYGLWVDRGGDLFQIRLSGEPEVVAAELDFDVRDDGSAQFSLRVTGYSRLAQLATASSVGTVLQQKVERYAERLLRAGVPGLEITHIEFAPPDNFAATPPVLEVHGTIGQALERLDDTMYAVGAPLKILAEALSIPTGGYTREDRAPETAAGRRWRVEPCCAGETDNLRGTIGLSLPSGWTLLQAPTLTDVGTPWMTAHVATEGTRWHVVIDESRGNFGSAATATRLADLNRIAKLLRSRFVIRRASS